MGQNSVSLCRGTSPWAPQKEDFVHGAVSSWRVAATWNIFHDWFTVVWEHNLDLVPGHGIFVSKWLCVGQWGANKIKGCPHSNTPRHMILSNFSFRNPDRPQYGSRGNCRPGWRQIVPRTDVVLTNVTLGDLSSAKHYPACRNAPAFEVSRLAR